MKYDENYNIIGFDQVFVDLDEILTIGAALAYDTGNGYLFDEV